MSTFAITAFPPIAHGGFFPNPITCSPAPLYAPVNPCPGSRPALRRTGSGSTAASDDLDGDGGCSLSCSSTHDSAMSALRRVRSLPGLGLRRMASRPCLTTRSSSTSSADEHDPQAAPSGLLRFFGKLVRRGRGRGRGRARAPGEGAAEDAGCEADTDAVVRPARPSRRCVSFADQPDLAERRPGTAREAGPPTPRLTGDDDDGSEDEQDRTSNEYVSLLRERRQMYDFMHSRKEPWWRASDEYYALAFPWC